MIPLSDFSRLQERDYTTVHFSQNDDRTGFLVTATFPDHMEGLRFNGRGVDPSLESITYSDASNRKIQITDYYKETEASYRSPYGYIFSRIIRWRYFLLSVSRFSLWLGRRKSIVRNDRITALERLVDHHVETNGNPVDPIDYVMRNHGDSFWLNRDSERNLSYYRLLFEGLAATGDLERIDNSTRFRVLGQSTATISEYAHQERRHQQQRVLNIALIILTLVLAVAAISQAIFAYKSLKDEQKIMELPSAIPSQDNDCYARPLTTTTALLPGRRRV